MTPAEKRRDAYLQRMHGISLKQYNEILDYQEGLCGACRQPPEAGKPLSVDHDHGSKAQEVEPFVRGLLHRACNRFLVGRHRDGDKLIQAGLYLNDPPATHVLPEHQKYPKKKRQPRKRPRNGGKR